MSLKYRLDILKKVEFPERLRHRDVLDITKDLI